VKIEKVDLSFLGILKYFYREFRGLTILPLAPSSSVTLEPWIFHLKNQQEIFIYFYFIFKVARFVFLF